MPTATLKAHVHYGDWHGTASSDDADSSNADMRRWLEKKGLAPKGQTLFAFEVEAGENHGKHKDPLWGHAMFVPLAEGQTIPDYMATAKGAPEVTRVSFKIDALEYIGLFKRFKVSFTMPTVSPELAYSYASN